MNTRQAWKELSSLARFLHVKVVLNSTDQCVTLVGDGRDWYPPTYTGLKQALQWLSFVGA